MYICFDRDRDRGQQELTDNKNKNFKYTGKIYSKDVFGFAEWQGRAFYGLGYQLTIKRNTDNAVLNKGNTVANAKIKINSFERYVPQYTLSIQQ